MQQDWNKKASQEAFVVIRVGDDGTLDQGIIGGSGEKWLDSGAMSKVESQTLTRDKDSRTMLQFLA